MYSPISFGLFVAIFSEAQIKANLILGLSESANVIKFLVQFFWIHVISFLSFVLC